jgi:hypothetical protein
VLKEIERLKEEGNDIEKREGGRTEQVNVR